MLASMQAPGRKQIEAARPPRAAVWGLALATSLGLASPPTLADPAPAPVVFAAASTSVPLGALGQAFEREQGGKVTFSFAASSTLARQIMHGARAAMFLSANQQWMNRLEQAGLLVEGSRRILAGNRLAVIRPKKSKVTVDLAKPSSLLDALKDLPLALADPAHVPAGIYAREALEHLGLWAELDGRLALVANARAVTALVSRGEAPLGISYASDLHGAAKVEAAVLLPASAHSPIRYHLALIDPPDHPVALAFFKFLFTEQAQAVFQAHGFTPRSELPLAHGAERAAPSLARISRQSAPHPVHTYSLHHRPGYASAREHALDTASLARNSGNW